MTQNDGTTRKFIRGRGLIQGRHVNESIQESPECIFEPSRYAHTRGYYGLIREDTMVSHERILWSIDGRCCLLCVGWQIRGVGGSVRAVKPIDEIVAWHFPGDFIVN